MSLVPSLIVLRTSGLGLNELRSGRCCGLNLIGIPAAFGRNWVQTTLSRYGELTPVGCWQTVLQRRWTPQVYESLLQLRKACYASRGQRTTETTMFNGVPCCWRIHATHPKQFWMGVSICGSSESWDVSAVVSVACDQTVCRAYAGPLSHLAAKRAYQLR